MAETDEEMFMRATADLSEEERDQIIALIQAKNKARVKKI